MLNIVSYFWKKNLIRFDKMASGKRVDVSVLKNIKCTFIINKI